MKPERIEQSCAVTSLYYTVCGGWKQELFFTSDNHFDSIFCNREQMRADFDEAKRRKARIYIVGDWFDAMQGRYDPRRSAAELRPEYQQREDYYDAVVNDAADWLEPYADLIDMISDGNHEIAVLKNASTNIADRLVVELNRRKKSKIQHGGYGGWIRMMMTMIDETRGQHMSVKIKYFHGAGGEAPVTRGAIQTNRQAVYLPDANVIVNGHSHNSYHIPIASERISNKGQLYFDTQHHIRTPGYKQAYGDGSTGWDVTRGGVPKPIGGAFVVVGVRNQALSLQVQPWITSPEPVSVSAEAIYTGKVWDDDREEE